MKMNNGEDTRRQCTTWFESFIYVNVHFQFRVYWWCSVWWASAAQWTVELKLNVNNASINDVHFHYTPYRPSYMEQTAFTKTHGARLHPDAWKTHLLMWHLTSIQYPMHSMLYAYSPTPLGCFSTPYLLPPSAEEEKNPRQGVTVQVREKQNRCGYVSKRKSNST